MNRPLITFLILILILAFGLWIFVWPEWQSFSLKNDEVKLVESNLAETRDLKNKFSELAAIYQSKEKAGELEKIFSALPAESDIPGLLVSLEALASQNGLVIKSVNFVWDSGTKDSTGASAADSAGAAAETASSSAVKNMDVILVLNGDYSSFVNFLRSAEKSLRLMDVKNLTFQQSDSPLVEGLAQSSDFSANMRVYYR